MRAKITPDNKIIISTSDPDDVARLKHFMKLADNKRYYLSHVNESFVVGGHERSACFEWRHYTWLGYWLRQFEMFVMFRLRNICRRVIRELRK